MDKYNQKSKSAQRAESKRNWKDDMHFAMVKKVFDDQGITFGSNFTRKEKQTISSQLEVNKLLLIFTLCFSWSDDHEKY